MPRKSSSGLSSPAPDHRLFYPATSLPCNIVIEHFTQTPKHQSQSQPPRCACLSSPPCLPLWLPQCLLYVPPSLYPTRYGYVLTKPNSNTPSTAGARPRTRRLTSSSQPYRLWIGQSTWRLRPWAPLFAPTRTIAMNSGARRMLASVSATR